MFFFTDRSDLASKLQVFSKKKMSLKICVECIL